MVTGQDSGRITGLLDEIKRGNRDAEATLIPFIYKELRRLAAGYMRRERPDHTLQTTALVHEAYVRLFGEQDVDYVDRGHFFAMAATVMRRILVDYARSRSARKRGGEVQCLALDEGIDIGTRESWDQILAVHEALARLADIDGRQARVVELRFFAGLDIEETAQVLNVSSRTVKRDWEFAQTWLYAQMVSPAKNLRR